MLINENICICLDKETDHNISPKYRKKKRNILLFKFYMLLLLHFLQFDIKCFIEMK